MTAQEFQDALTSLLQAAGYLVDLNEDSDAGDLDAEVEPFIGCHVNSFSDRGLMTLNAGVVVRLADGSEFQVTIVRSD